MRRFLNDLMVQLKGIWARLDGAQRLVVTAVLAAAVVGLAATLWFAGRPSYQEVYSASSPEEVRDARRLLGQAAIPFITDESGRSILVERARVPMANAVLFEGGLRTAGTARGNDGVAGLLADSDTRADLLDNKARARAEEAIRQLEGVVAATVTATRPRRSPFRDRETPARATVAVRLRPGVAFEAVAKAAASHAASAVGVPLQQVEVVNAANHARWSHDPDRGGAGSSEFLGLQRQLSDDKTRAAQNALDAVYPGMTIVTVDVELDPLWEVTVSKVVPTEPLVRSDRTTKDSTDSGAGGSAGSGGDPSPAADGGNGSGGGGNRNTTRKETRDREFVTEIGERRQGRQAPAIKKLSVALLYDKSLEKDGFQPDQLANVVKSIVGWDDQRDQTSAFSILAGEFPAEQPLTLTAGPGFGDLAVSWAPIAAQLIGLLVVLLFLKGLFKRAPRPVEDMESLPATAEEDLPAEEQARRMRRDIERAIASDPAKLARLLENWLTEQKA